MAGSAQKKLVLMFTAAALAGVAPLFPYTQDCFAQDTTDSAAPADTTAPAAEDTPEARVRTVIDETPITSARAAAMGGAVSTIADNVDAAFFNPAGIGGYSLNKSDASWIRKLYFPLLSVEANSASSKLYGEVKREGGGSDSTIGRAIVDAHAGERQFARANMTVASVIGRTIILPINDVQVAAASRGEDSGLIDLRYRSLSGIGAGFSATDPQERFAIGYFGFTANRTETQGTFDYDTIINKELRSAAVKENSEKYSGTGHNAGIRWRMAKQASPTLAVAVRNAGGTTYKAKEGGEDLEVKQDLTVGFSFATALAKTGALTFVIEAGRLTDDEVAFNKKYRIGTEMALGGTGSYATFSLRAGYNDAGGSGGLLLNLGLVGLEAGVQSVDIGIGNEKVIEQRMTGTVFVNLAEF